MWVGDSRRDQTVRKDPTSTGRETVERPCSEYVASSGQANKDIFKERQRLPARSSPDDWRCERRRPSQGRASDDRRPRSRQTANDRGSFVLTVNTGSRYQPASSRERRFTIPRTGGAAYCSSHSRGSARAAAPSSTGSLSSFGGRERSGRSFVDVDHDL